MPGVLRPTPLLGHEGLLLWPTWAQGLSSDFAETSRDLLGVEAFTHILPTPFHLDETSVGSDRSPRLLGLQFVQFLSQAFLLIKSCMLNPIFMSAPGRTHINEMFCKQSKEKGWSGGWGTGELAI